MNSNHEPNQSKFRRVVAAILIVFVLIAIMGAVLVLRCLSFDGNGAHVIDRYGILAQESETTQLEHSGSGSVETAPNPPQEKNSAEQEEQIRTVMLTAEAATDSDVCDQLIRLKKDNVVDTVVIDIKDSDGYLYLECDTDIVETERITSRDASDLVDAIAQMKEAGLSVAGRIYCLHDQQAAQLNAGLSIQYMNGGTWLDYDSTRWLDPTDSDAIQYLCDVARTAVNAGCDQLVLDELQLPPRGHLDRASFDETPDEQAAVLADVLRAIAQDVGDVPVSLTAESVSTVTELSEKGAEDGIEVGDPSTLLRAAKQLLLPLEQEDKDGVAQLNETITDLASDAVVVPVFVDADAWMSYSGSAVLDAVSDSDVLFDLEQSEENDTEEDTQSDDED